MYLKNCVALAITGGFGAPGVAGKSRLVDSDNLLF